jgi:hypothetical protein
MSLVCSVRERARRLIARELAGRVPNKAEEILGRHDCSTLEARASVVRTSRSSECRDASVVLDREATRERDGWRRLGVLYGAVDGIEVDATVEGSTAAAVLAIASRV